MRLHIVTPEHFHPGVKSFDIPLSMLLLGVPRWLSHSIERGTRWASLLRSGRPGFLVRPDITRVSDRRG